MNLNIASLLAAVVLCLVQLVAALPWLAAIDPRVFFATMRKPSTWLWGIGGAIAAGLLLSAGIGFVQDPGRLTVWGRLFGALLHAQLTIDFFALLFPMLLFVWPQGGTVALAAFREGVRQPLFWLITGTALGVLVLSPVFPYFTFGEDYKLVRELGHAIPMLAAAVFGVVLAST